mgnify:CR=1 FL=1
MRSALGGKGINETRALQGSMGRRKQELKKKGPQRKNSLLFWPKVWISPRNVEEVNWFEPNDQEGRASMLF